MAIWVGDMQCDEVRELADAYGLGALDAAEREAADRHAESCPTCRRLLEEASLAASSIALATPVHRAPAALHSSVMRQVAAEPSGSGRAIPLGRFPNRAGALTTSHEIPRRAPPKQGSAPWWWGKQGLAASLAVLLLLGAAAGIAGLEMQVNRLQARSQSLQRGLADFEGQRAALMLLASDGTSRFPMQATDAGTPATGAVIWNRSQKRCSVFAAGLPSVSDQQVYHVWLIGDNRSWDEGELASGERGTAEKTIDLSRYADQSSYQLVVAVQPRVQGSGEWHPILRAWVGAQ
jgi:hypothetical protein